MYIRVVDQEGVVQKRLLCAKYCVASFKTISLPSLQLCGVILLAHFLRNVSYSLLTHIDDIFL